MFATLRLNFSRTNISTAKPMIVGCVQHYSNILLNWENRQSCFFIKSKKLKKKGKKGPKRGKKGDFSYFRKKRATLRSSPYGCLTSCQISEKSLERFLRKAIPDGRTNERTRLILQVPPVFNRGPITLGVEQQIIQSAN